MEYCYRSPWIRNKFINDSSRNWILTELSDHIRIPISYLNALLSGLLARIETDPFWVHVDGLRNLNLKISTYWDTLSGLFSEIFWLRKEKKNDYPLYEDSVRAFEVICKNKTRIVVGKQS